MILDLPPQWALRNAVLLSDGIGGLVWSAVDRDGQAVIVKRVSDVAIADHATGESFMRWRDGSACVRLLDVWQEWQLLEHAGHTTLREVFDREGDDTATVIAADLVASLRKPVSDTLPHDLLSLDTHFSSLTKGVPPGADPDQAALIARGAATARALLAENRTAIPLHGDIHHENILHGRRGWLSIDAKGLLGDPDYETANLFYNPVEADARYDTQRAARMSEILAARLDAPAPRLLRFAMAHACLSACWHFEDGSVERAAQSLGVAAAIMPLTGI